MSDNQERLLELAKAAFPDLTAPERRVVEAAARGKDADFRSGDPEKPEKDDPAKAETWGDNRKVRAAVIHWLCVDADARRLVDPMGVQVQGARIEGPLNLDFARMPFPLLLSLSGIPEGIFLRESRAASISFEGTHTGPISADRLTVDGTVFLRNGFLAKGLVRLLGARIHGILDCTKGTFMGTEIKTPKGKTRIALTADRLDVGGGVFLREGFHATGEVRLLGAHIRGDLDCHGGTFENPGAEALNADSLVVGGNVFLTDEFRARGQVRLLGARIRGNLECNAGTFEGAEIETPEGKTIVAVVADGVEVGGGVFLREGFCAKGEVRLLGTRIRSNLDCTGGTFENPGGKALNADGLEVGGGVLLSGGFLATGEVRLLGARIRGDLDCDGGTFENPGGKALSADGLEIGGGLFLRQGFQATGKVSLVHAKARVLADDEASWPGHGNLDLQGFVYEGIIGPTDAATRLRWLARQYPEKRRRGHYYPQPYEQLAAVLRRAGHVAESKKVLMAKEKDLRKYGDLGPLARVWNWILGATIGYGYRVRYALGLAAGIVLLGVLFFWLGHRAGLLSPTFPSRAETAAPSEKRLDEAFCPWVYSLDTFLPIVNLYQEARWLPNDRGGDVVTAFCPDRCIGLTWSHLLWAWFWIEILAGWLLTTLALAGLTGLIRRD